MTDASSTPVKLDCGVEIIPLPGNAHTTHARLHELQAYMTAHEADVVEMGGEKYAERASRLPSDALRNVLGTEQESQLGEVEHESLLRSTNWVIDVTSVQAPTEFHVHRVGPRGTVEGKMGGTRLLEFYSDKGCTLEFFRVDEAGKPLGPIEHVDVAPGACLVKFNATNIAHSFQAKHGGICLGVSNHPMDGIGSYGAEGIMNNTGDAGFKVTIPDEKKVITIQPPVVAVDIDRAQKAMAQALSVEAVGFYDPKGLLQTQAGLQTALGLMDDPAHNAVHLKQLIADSIEHIRNANLAKTANVAR